MGFGNKMCHTQKVEKDGQDFRFSKLPVMYSSKLYNFVGDLQSCAFF